MSGTSPPGFSPSPTASPLVRLEERVWCSISRLSRGSLLPDHGALGQHLVDLNPKLGDEAKKHYQTIIENNTVNNALVGMPWFGDFGMLFYRKDLLQKYNLSAPPATWDELEQQANTIVNGEKGSNPNFAGFVFQGNAYEGLTCNALEWLASSGGGTRAVSLVAKTCSPNYNRENRQWPHVPRGRGI